MIIWQIVQLSLLLIGLARLRSTERHHLAPATGHNSPDVPVDTAAWAAYRQALRNVTEQQGFPWNVAWLDQP